MNLDSTVIVCAHNEECNIGVCLRAVLAQTVPPSQIIIVLDRCTDKTENVAKKTLGIHSPVLVRKEAQRWKNSISENLELARAKATGAALVVVDADIVVPPDFLERILPQLKEYSSVSATARTDSSQGLLNELVSIWEKTYRLAPFGQQPRGGARGISASDLEKLGGFRDVIAWDSDIDSRFRKSRLKVKLDNTLFVLHRRRMTLRRSVAYQIQAGKARKELGVSFGLTLMHSVFRLRPFVVYGYLRARI